MSLTKRQVEDIARFDWERRTGGDFDGRRYGSVTGDHVPAMTEDWTPCRGVNPQDVRAGIVRPLPPRKTLRYNYIIAGRAGKDGRRPDVTVAHVAVRLDWAYRQVVKDVGRWHIKTGRLELRDIGYHGCAGWLVSWDRKDRLGDGKRTAKARPPKRGAAAGAAATGQAAGHDGRQAAATGQETGHDGQGATAGQNAAMTLARVARAGTPVDKGWSDGGKWKFGAGLTFPWHETVNPDALRGTRYEWCQWTSDTGLVDWLMLYRQEPKIELLVKAGLHSLVCPSGLRALKDRRVRDLVMAHRGEIAADEDVSVRDITLAVRRGVTLKVAMRAREIASEVRCRVDMREVRVRPDWVRLTELLPKWGVHGSEYARYLMHAHEAGLDLRDAGTLYPSAKGGREAFMARLEDVEARAAAAARRRRKKECERLKRLMASRLAEIEGFQRSLGRVKALKGCWYAIVLAKSQKELLAEGKLMHNCVGNGTYGEGILAGDLLIAMLRDADGKSYCDIEIVRRGWKVRQCYLKRNGRAPQEVRDLADRIAAALKAEHARGKGKKTPKREVA